MVTIRALQRLLDYDLATIPPALLTPIPRFAIVACAGGFIVWYVADAPLAIVLGLCFGLIVASPLFGPERVCLVRRLPMSRGSRAIQICSEMFLIVLVAVTVCALIKLPIWLAFVCLGMVSCLFVCLTGLINLFVELLRIARTPAIKEL